MVTYILTCILVRHAAFNFTTHATKNGIHTTHVTNLPINGLALTIYFLNKSYTKLTNVIRVTTIRHQLGRSVISDCNCTKVLITFISQRGPLTVIVISVLLKKVLTDKNVLRQSRNLPSTAIVIFRNVIFLYILFDSSLCNHFTVFRSQPTHPTITPTISI